MPNQLRDDARSRLLLTTAKDSNTEDAPSSVDGDCRRTDRRFVLLMHAQWIAAIGFAACFTPHTSLGQRIPNITLLAFVGGGLSTLTSVLSVRQWARRERAQQSQRIALQEQQQHELLHRAFHDRDTGLPNRAALEPQLDSMLERGDTLSCLYVEVEDISSPDEFLGHKGNEILLQSVLTRLQARVQHDDELGRIACDKFVLLVRRPQTRAQLTALAESIVRTMSAPHYINGHSITTDVSIGIASTPTDAHDRESLLAAADRTVYTARCEGRNTYRFACDLRTPSEESNALLAIRLQRALHHEELTLFYQPIYSIGERMVAVEALSRWQTEQGPISPADFIPVAESTGLIVPLSNWVLRQACKQMAEWVVRGTSLERLAVNVSVKHVAREDFVPTVEQTLQQTGLKPSRLELEVTESALVSDFEAVKKNLQALRRLGIRISIDDFGTGYSSFSRLRELSADTLKIDRAFVQGATDSPNGLAVVRAIVDVAHTLNLSVIAEGIETEEQLQMLRGVHCDEMQGFLLARPQSAESLTASLDADARPRQGTKLSLVSRVA